MDLAGYDLQNHQLARQLHLMSHLYEVFLTNAMCYPLFYESLHPSAKQQARTVLLALNRVFEKGERGGSTFFTRSPYRLYTMRCVLSYLVYPDCILPWPRCVSRLIGSSTTATAPQLEETQSTPPPLPATASSSLDATPLRSDSTVETVAPAQTHGGSTDPSSTAAQSPPAPSLPPPLSPAALKPASSVVAAPAAVADIALRPLFYIRPVAAQGTDRSAPYFGTTTQIYVRMVHPHLLNEESLNPFFGRYGQVDCTAIQRTSLLHYAAQLGEAATEALHQLFAASNTSDSSALYVQDFIISVDSHQNAVHAVRRAYYKELVCIALHDATGVHNTHCLADVNGWMRRHAFVWRLRGEVGVSAAEKEAAENAAVAAAVAKRRKRARAKHRRREQKRRRRAVLGKGGSSSHSSASTSASESDADKDGESSGSESGSSSTTDSSSSSSSGVEDDLAQFVPDVVLDGFPYWTTEDQLKVLLQEYGTVVELRLSLDDLSGAFTGCVLVRMSTLDEAIHVSRALHDTLHRGHRLISGVINEKLEVVALEDGEDVRIPAIPEQVPYDVSLNERVWV
ncbi:putative Rna-binding protein [Leptomonas pyrrhocoris]|uniref:Putative Rna-binding protein n=1 Tax=Leptomonas pyrrhocoris TaxID=157538 RepID=A0A0N0DZ84_LEPPY|nr:putative Rna-binding protein [Leptomonas pyrrhocoris]KPA84992.1 putative Rna-binding protein [Leptomonas pyrrhocoris]|eukprot:XP_015663431.1 putative Rna-binding protein [Leptomonas pyrrhocoris]